MIRAVIYIVVGFLLGAGFMAKKNYDHIDVMQRIAHNMAEDSFYTGCRAAGGAPNECHYKTEEYIVGGIKDE